MEDGVARCFSEGGEKVSIAARPIKNVLDVT